MSVCVILYRFHGYLILARGLTPVHMTLDSESLDVALTG